MFTLNYTRLLAFEATVQYNAQRKLPKTHLNNLFMKYFQFREDKNIPQMFLIDRKKCFFCVQIFILQKVLLKSFVTVSYNKFLTTSTNINISVSLNIHVVRSWEPLYIVPIQLSYTSICYITLVILPVDWQEVSCIT